MTFTEEFPGSDIEYAEKPAYPTVFGIAFTPTIIGVIFALLGLGSAVYMLLNYVQPEWQKYQDQEAANQSKQQQIDQQQANLKKLDQKQAELEKAKQQNRAVLAFFGSEKSLDTLLLDMNRFIASRQGNLQRFEPVPPEQAAAPAATPALGNGKLTSQFYNVQFQGSFDQTVSILRSLERMPLLLQIEGFRTELGTDEKQKQKLTLNRQFKVVSSGQPSLNTTFKVEALIPASANNNPANPGTK